MPYRLDERGKRDGTRWADCSYLPQHRTQQMQQPRVFPRVDPLCDPIPKRARCGQGE